MAGGLLSRNGSKICFITPLQWKLETSFSSQHGNVYLDVHFFSSLEWVPSHYLCTEHWRQIKLQLWTAYLVQTIHLLRILQIFQPSLALNKTSLVIFWTKPTSLRYLALFFDPEIFGEQPLSRLWQSCLYGASFTSWVNRRSQELLFRKVSCWDMHCIWLNLTAAFYEILLVREGLNAMM